MLSNQQALNKIFTRKVVRGSLARWLSFLAEHVFGVSFQRSSLNCAVEFFSSITHADRGIEGYIEEALEYLIFEKRVMETLNRDFKPNLRDITHHLTEVSLENKTKSEKANIWRRAVRFIQWVGRLFRHGRMWLLAEVSRSNLTKVQHSLHDRPGL